MEFVSFITILLHRNKGLAKFDNGLIFFGEFFLPIRSELPNGFLQQNYEEIPVTEVGKPIGHFLCKINIQKRVFQNSFLIEILFLMTNYLNPNLFKMYETKVSKSNLAQTFSCCV